MPLRDKEMPASTDETDRELRELKTIVAELRADLETVRADVECWKQASAWFERQSRDLQTVAHP